MLDHLLVTFPAFRPSEYKWDENRPNCGSNENLKGPCCAGRTRPWCIVHMKGNTLPTKNGRKGDKTRKLKRCLFLGIELGSHQCNGHIWEGWGFWQCESVVQ